MTWEVVLGCVVIIIARIGDVSLGSMRTVAVVSGHRGLAWIFGLIEMIIWVYAVSAVVANIRTEPAYGVAFAVGAATGSYVGVTLQRWLTFGEQVVRIFTRRGEELFEHLKCQGFGVTHFQGTGRDGPVSMLFVQVRRSRTARVVSAARAFDSSCFYTIDDIRVANAAGSGASPSGPAAPAEVACASPPCVTEESAPIAPGEGCTHENRSMT
ncbi:MAG: DUF2179 domain-containing protein [Leptolyngbya sp. PLA3]|nr:MAG: DUF2179 domain-containing protein [Cyanobacteria bacterium CYA]MCE7967487.1 DUF2179 domain-containing protein [Leptolyngbya sp. PL-A3]